jgi:hypothetical protein
MGLPRDSPLDNLSLASRSCKSPASRASRSTGADYSMIKAVVKDLKAASAAEKVVCFKVPNMSVSV